MVKNKKGKKKNKMAGRNRPNPEQATECEDKNAPVALSDTSETEDRADRARGGKEGVTPEPEVLTSDSGIDSGRGSPGDDRDSSKATGAAKINTQPRITEEGTLEDAKVESAPAMNPDRAEAIPAGVAAEVEARSPVPLDVRKSEQSAENPQVGSEQKIESKTEERAEKHAEEPATVPSAKPGVVKDSARRGVSARPKGASSLRRHSPVENIKHPLEFPWEFWIMDKEQSWELALKPLASFDTAEDFWLYFNRLRDPRALGKEILMFKKHIKPEWEHPRNENGGRWNLSHGLHGRAAEEVWQELALMMIGGIKFDALTPHLNGIYCTWKNDGIHYSVWIDSTEDRIARPIGNIIHETLFSILNKSFHMELVQCNSKKRDRRRVLLDIR